MNSPTKIVNWKSANLQQALVKAAVLSVSKCARVNLFSNRFYMFKVNLFVHGAGRYSGFSRFVVKFSIRPGETTAHRVLRVSSNIICISFESKG